MKLLNPLPNAELRRYPLGAIMQGFGEHPELYDRVLQKKGHNGIDIATYYGDAVVAAHDGVVVHDGWRGGYGFDIELYNEGLKIRTNYAHLLKDPPVKIGDEVKVGQIIGYEGNSGFVVSGGTPYWNWFASPDKRGTHLHFGLQTNVEKGAFPGNQTYFPDSKVTISTPAAQGIDGWVDSLPYLINDIEPDMLTKEQIVMLSRLVWHREPDPQMFAMEGKELNFLLDEWYKAKEFPYYDDVYRTVKKVEHAVRNGEL